MSKLEEMLERLCPNGVERKSLGTVVNVLRGERVTKKELRANGEYPVISGGVRPLGWLGKYNREAGTITVAQYGSAGYVDWQERRFWANDVCYCLEPICDLSEKYLYYVLKRNQSLLYSLRIEAVPAHLPKDRLLDFKIPFPPRPVQDEIVKALDALDAAVKALEEERAARQEQFEALREKLVNAGGKVELGTVAHYSQERVATSQIAKGNYVNVELLLPNKMGRAERSLVPHESNCVRFKSGDVLIGNIRPYLKKIWLADVNGGTNGDVLVVTPNDDGKLNSKYLFYALSQDDFFTYASCKVKAGKMPRGDKASMLRYAISMPDVSTQQKIAEQLDAFAAVVAAQDEEVAARREQFAGWLEKLMKFDAREVAVA